MFRGARMVFFQPERPKISQRSAAKQIDRLRLLESHGTDKSIVLTSGSTSSQKVGVKKSLVFYKGRPLKGLKTNWIMHEYRLAETMLTERKGSMRLDDWVLCRIYQKVSQPARVFSCPELEAPSPGDVQQKLAMPEFGSSSRLLQTEGPFMESFLSHGTSDANEAHSYMEPSSSHQVVPEQQNKLNSNPRGRVPMPMGFNGDEASSVNANKRQNTQNPSSSSLHLQSWNPYVAGVALDEHRHRFPFNKNSNPELPAWPLPPGNVWLSYDIG